MYYRSRLDYVVIMRIVPLIYRKVPITIRQEKRIPQSLPRLRRSATHQQCNFDHVKGAIFTTIT
uniref:Uncharacterized protein n=1 Tax=Onchocerca volvulus TaxID=6282 RepID=A0A8R1XWE3_ONCVO